MTRRDLGMHGSKEEDLALELLVIRPDVECEGDKHTAEVVSLRLMSEFPSFNVRQGSVEEIMNLGVAVRGDQLVVETSEGIDLVRFTQELTYLGWLIEYPDQNTINTMMQHA